MIDKKNRFSAPSASLLQRRNNSALDIWVIRDFEPLPIDPGRPKLMRSGLLCQALVERGHRVTWVSSDYDHYGKRKRPGGRQQVRLADNYVIEILPSLGYSKNVSARRVLHNALFARTLRAFAAQAPSPPDIIVTDIPTTEVAKCTVSLAQDWGIPSVLSIRDLWPDSMTNLLPQLVRPFSQVLFGRMRAEAQAACRGASVLVGISEGYLDWGLAMSGRERRAADSVIPLGYETQVESGAVQSPQSVAFLKSLGIGPNDRVVSFIGSWGHTHDLETVAKAAQLLANRTEVKFVIAGDGDMRSLLAPHFAKVPSVVLPGWLDHEQIGWLLSRTEVGLMPYQPDAPQGLPNKIFQYMAAGVYQVSTLGGEAADLLRSTGTGTTCVPSDPEAMAACIVTSMSCESPAIRKSEIARIAQQKFDANGLYARFAALIEDTTLRT